MKVFKNESEKEFKPFSFIVQIETEDDLRALWHRFAIHGNEVKKLSDEKLVEFPISFSSDYEIFSFVAGKIEEFGMKE